MIKFPDNIRAIKPYRPGKPLALVAEELGLENIIELASNQSPYGASPLAKKAFQHAASGLQAYPDSDGWFLRQDLSAHLGRPADWFMLGNGSCEIIEILAKALLGNDGNGVFSEGAFIMMRIAIMTVNGRVNCTPMKNLGHDLEAMAKAVNPQTRLVYVANPNNPTGTWLSRQALLDFARSLPKHVVLIVDEAYREYAQGYGCESMMQHLDDLPNMIVLGTFSKAHGLAGLRIGYGCAHPDFLEQLGKVRSPFNTNQPAQEAARASLRDLDFLQRNLERTKKEMTYLARGLKRLGFSFPAPVANFLCAEPADNFSTVGPALSQALLTKGVFIRPLVGYGLPRHVRISAGTRPQNQVLLKALAEL